MINVDSNDLIAFGNGIFFNAFTKYPAMIPAISAPINPDWYPSPQGSVAIQPPNIPTQIPGLSAIEYATYAPNTGTMNVPKPILPIQKIVDANVEP